MRVSFSQGVLCEFPNISKTVNSVKRVARELDRGIKVKSLLVEARLSPSSNKFNGWAHPEPFSVSRGNWRYHANGRVQMSIGNECSDEDISRLFAHELRHIGQFNRGRDKYGILTITPLTPDESEEDAYDFEEKVLKLI